MIDFHTHILPGIDDGSRDLEETKEMLQEEAAQGVSHIVATPHFYAHRRSIEFFLTRREGSLKTVADFNAPILVGAEVYFFPGMGRADKLRSLCIGETDLILVEMPFDQWTEEVYTEIKDIIYKQKLRVILAHVERYPHFQKKQDIWDRIMELPLTVQLNAGSFTGGFRQRRFALNMLKQNGNVILGSDCHNMDTRRPNLSEARNVIKKKIGEGRLKQLDETAANLLGV